MKTTEEPIQAIHFLARKLVAKWAKNFRDPERLVLRRDRVAAALTEGQRRKLVRQIEDIASTLRHAFQSEDEYERDWFLTWARSLNAQNCVDAEIERMPGGIPMAKESTMERAIFYVQKFIAHTMRVCPVCDTCFFQRKAKQKLCGKKCRLAAKKASNLRCWHAHDYRGSDKR